MAQSGHSCLHRTCLLSGVKRTWVGHAVLSPRHGAAIGTYVKFGIVVNRPGATCSDAVEADSQPRGNARERSPKLAKCRQHLHPLPIGTSYLTSAPASATRRWNS